VSSLYGEGNGSSTFNVPDLRGRFIAGWDAGTSVLTSVTAGMIVGSPIATVGGTQAVQLTVDQIPDHEHTYTRYGQKQGGNEGGGAVWLDDNTVSTGGKGGDGYHSNIPPAMILNFIIKT